MPNISDSFSMLNFYSTHISNQRLEMLGNNVAAGNPLFERTIINDEDIRERTKTFKEGVEFHRERMSSLLNKVQTLQTRLQAIYQSMMDRMISTNSTTQASPHDVPDNWTMDTWRSVGRAPLMFSKGANADDVNNDADPANDDEWITGPGPLGRLAYLRPNSPSGSDQINFYQERGGFYSALTYLWQWDLHQVKAQYATGVSDGYDLSNLNDRQVELDLVEINKVKQRTWTIGDLIALDLPNVFTEEFQNNDLGADDGDFGGAPGTLDDSNTYPGTTALKTSYGDIGYTNGSGYDFQANPAQLFVRVDDVEYLPDGVTKPKAFSIVKADGSAVQMENHTLVDHKIDLRLGLGRGANGWDDFDTFGDPTYVYGSGASERFWSDNLTNKTAHYHKTVTIEANHLWHTQFNYTDGVDILNGAGSAGGTVSADDDSDLRIAKSSFTGAAGGVNNSAPWWDWGPDGIDAGFIDNGNLHASQTGDINTGWFQMASDHGNSHGPGPAPTDSGGSDTMSVLAGHDAPSAAATQTFASSQFANGGFQVEFSLRGYSGHDFGGGPSGNTANAGLQVDAIWNYRTIANQGNTTDRYHVDGYGNIYDLYGTGNSSADDFDYIPALDQNRTGNYVGNIFGSNTRRARAVSLDRDGDDAIDRDEILPLLAIAERNYNTKDEYNAGLGRMALPAPNSTDDLTANPPGSPNTYLDPLATPATGLSSGLKEINTYNPSFAGVYMGFAEQEYTTIGQARVLTDPFGASNNTLHVQPFRTMTGLEHNNFTGTGTPPVNALIDRNYNAIGQYDPYLSIDNNGDGDYTDVGETAVATRVRILGPDGSLFDDAATISTTPDVHGFYTVTPSAGKEMDPTKNYTVTTLPDSYYTSSNTSAGKDVVVARSGGSLENSLAKVAMNALNGSEYKDALKLGLLDDLLLTGAATTPFGDQIQGKLTLHYNRRQERIEMYQNAFGAYYKSTI